MAILRSVSRLVVLLALTASPGVGQVLEGPEGPVEIIGLERWTAQGLLEAIQQTAPGQPLHACAATMRFELGFADAGVFGYLESTTSRSERYTVIIGIEDQARVRYRTPGNETIALPESWQALKSVADEDLQALGMARELFDLRHDRETARKLAELFDSDLAAIEPVWELIAALDGEQDRLLAQRILANADSWSSRAIAATVLLNFGEDDTAWHDLVSATIDPIGQVSGAAASVLRSLVQMESGRSVRWDAGARTDRGGARRHQSVRVPGGGEGPGRHRDRARAGEAADPGRTGPPARARRRPARRHTPTRDRPP